MNFAFWLSFRVDTDKICKEIYKYLVVFYYAVGFFVEI
ncbi:MAG: hypothetical protein DF168_00140 [Candidatus Moanabacter tarae]|uniref:Uncharacterized protein n=1 Tax=Candidatus Moanibacter tarae TaxID=2200854 RepID=A0A2Z4ADI5_9BACT|nr:MAG: hypothetical protein DF168_00140 [Candidatus Moanabacter tarae]